MLFTLPDTTRIITSKYPRSKTFVTYSLVCGLLQNNENAKLLLISEPDKDFLFTFDVTRIDHNAEKIEGVYDYVVLDLTSFIVDLEKMEFESWFDLSPTVVTYLDSLKNDQTKLFINTWIKPSLKFISTLKI